MNLKSHYKTMVLIPILKCDNSSASLLRLFEIIFCKKISSYLVLIINMDEFLFYVCGDVHMTGDGLYIYHKTTFDYW
jgi:hypothetical protein